LSTSHSYNLWVIVGTLADFFAEDMGARKVIKYNVKDGHIIQPPFFSSGTSSSLLSHSVPQVPMHNPSVSVPSTHDVLLTQVKPDTGVFVHDPPEGSAAEQSPAASALGRSSDASQFAKMGGD
jgi:hypothetical protein